jgi:Tfp pilus assembly protein PilF
MKRIYGLLGTLGIGLLLILAAGCTATHKYPQGKVPAEEMHKYAEKVLSHEEMQHFKVPYEIGDQLRTIAKEVDKGGYSKTFMARELALMLLEDGALGVSYNRDSNATAEEVYAKKQANCISFTNLFIGMARSLGIDANYAEVTEVSSFDKMGNTIIYNTHVCAVVFEGPRVYLIDFSFRPNPQYHSWRAISDLEAVADFYNNIASQYYLKSDDLDHEEKALEYYNMALKIYPDSVSTFNNLGVLKLRENDFEGAEQMFLKALQLRPGYFAAYTNLGSIYRKRGEIDKAIELLQAAIDASPTNPYSYHSLAKLYLEIDEKEKAEENLKKALRIDKRFTEARHELGRLYLRMGRGKEALQQFALALKYQPDDTVARNKMDLIRQLTMEQ